MTELDLINKLSEEGYEVLDITHMDTHADENSGTYIATIFVQFGMVDVKEGEWYYNENELVIN